jgi:type II secretion system protein N
MKVRLPGSAEIRPSSQLQSPYAGWPVRLSRQRHFLLAGYGVFATLLFVSFLTANFPYAEIISAVVAPLRMKVVFQSQEMNFPLGARFRDVRLVSTGDEQLLVQSPEIAVSPSVTGILLGRPRFSIHAQIYGGVVNATVRQRAQNSKVDFELVSLSLAQLSRSYQPKLWAQAQQDQQGTSPPQSWAILNGEVWGTGSVEVTGTDIMASTANLVLSARHIEVAIVNGLPPIKLAVVHGKLLFEHGVASLQHVTANGSDGYVEVNGNVELTPYIANSFAQLTLSVTLTGKGRARFGGLVTLLPHPPDDGPYRLAGPLTSPSLS